MEQQTSGQMQQNIHQQEADGAIHHRRARFRLMYVAKASIKQLQTTTPPPPPPRWTATRAGGHQKLTRRECTECTQIES